MVVRVSFIKLKASVRIEQLIPYLGLDMKREGKMYRGRCPICRRGGDRALVLNTAQNLYYCHGKCQSGGDIITLVATVNKTSLEDAAKALHRDFHLGN